MMPLKYLSGFWRTLEMTLITCEIILILTRFPNSVISNAVANQAITFAITDTKLYVSIVILSTQDNSKLLPQLKAASKRTVNWNKYQLKKKKKRKEKHKTKQPQNRHLDYLIDPSFQGVDRLLFYHFQMARLERETEYIFFQEWK